MASQQLLVQKRFFSQEPPKQPQDEAKQEEVPKTEKEPVKEEHASSGGGSALPLIGGLAVLGGVGFMMSQQGGDQKKEASEPKKEEAAVAEEPEEEVEEVVPDEPTPEMFPVEGEPNLVDVEIKEALSMEDGMMKQVKVGPGKKDHVVVTKHDGKLYAIGAYCSHQGQRIVNGVVFDEKVLSPSAAAYDLASGIAENAPALDGLATYAVNEKEGKWFVRVPKELKQHKTTPMAKRDPNNRTKFLIIGGGAAGLSCAETLR